MAEYSFSQEHRWSVKLHFLSGITLLPWMRLLWVHRNDIDILSYGHRVLFLTFMSLVNTLLAVPDWLLYSRRISRQALHPRPVFILGHPRTGTTHLHNLLALDPRFAYATTFHAGFPSAFLWLEPFRSIFSGFLTPTRPMDNMKLSWQLPAEDEIAVCSLTGGVSPYMGIVLPREEKQTFRRFYRFLRHDPGSEQFYQLWRLTFLWFLKKVTFRWRSLHGTPKPLLIKSPTHTARIPLFLDLFPEAQFIYIHRNPLEVFQSAAHMADAYYCYTYLQRPTNAHLTDFVLDQFDLLITEYESTKHLVPVGSLHETTFSQLETDPLGSLEALYTQMGWDNFSEMRPKFATYCLTLQDFKKNSLKSLSSEVEARVRFQWAHEFVRHGYS
ncbi:MAG: hypothetical protein WDW38_008946 [Sanguina aurantia]